MNNICILILFWHINKLRMKLRKELKKHLKNLKLKSSNVYSMSMTWFEIMSIQSGIFWTFDPLKTLRHYSPNIEMIAIRRFGLSMLCFVLSMDLMRGQTSWWISMSHMWAWTQRWIFLWGLLTCKTKIIRKLINTYFQFCKRTGKTFMQISWWASCTLPLTDLA